MKSKSKTTKTLQIITGIFAALYFIVTAIAFFFEGGSFTNLIDILPLVLLLICITGFALSWTNITMAGIILMIWNAGVWISDLYLLRGMDYSMMSALASSFMVLGAFFLLEWYKTNKATLPSEKQQWRYILRVLLVNYVVLYAIVVVSELFAGEPVNYLSFPFIIYPLLLFIFLVGFLLSWKWELLAGYVFLFCFVILIFANIAYVEVRSLGGWAIFGLPILLQGIFYIKNHYKFRPK